MAAIAFNKTASSPNLEFVFKRVGKRVKLNVPNNVWRPEYGFYTKPGAV